MFPPDLALWGEELRKVSRHVLGRSRVVARHTLRRWASCLRDWLHVSKRNYVKKYSRTLTPHILLYLCCLEVSNGGLSETDSGLWRTDIVLWFLNHVPPETGQQRWHEEHGVGGSSPGNIVIAVVVVLLVVDEVVPEPVSWILSLTSLCLE